MANSKKCSIFAAKYLNIMKRHVFTLLLFLSAFLLSATNRQDLDSLFHYMQLAPQYDSLREQRLESYHRLLQSGGADKYSVYCHLYEECRSYNFDRAIGYVEEMASEARLQNDSDKIAHAAIQKGFAYLSAGLFKEGSDLFEELDTAGMKHETKVDYYITYARLLYDLANYDHVDMSNVYNHRGDALMREALALLTPQDTALYWRSKAMLDQHEGLAESSIKRYQLALQDTRIDEHERAVYLSTIAYLYSTLNDAEAQQHNNIWAAIADIKSSTKETVAMRWVAEQLYREGDIENAVICIKYALDDARFYNARHRQVEISQILPIIERDNAMRLQRRNRLIYILLACTLGLLMLCFVALQYLRKRNRELTEAQSTIENMNESLLVANKVKEEYIASFLCWQSEFITEVEKYQRHVRRAADQRKLEDLQQVPRQVEAARRREEFYRRFDEMFLHIFPTFVADFNAILRPEEPIELKTGELLNTELRIFALIRLGITHNEVIAEVLNYSVNTIYTYKTKIKNRSNLSNEEFLARVMDIPSFK